MVAIDYGLCTECGTCTRRFQNYCIVADGKRPSIRYELCNQCQRCISICPQQAIRMNGVAPRKIDAPLNLDPKALEELMARRRSTKKFKKEPLPWDLVREILLSAGYAPNQNKNISLLAIDHPRLIEEIDKKAVGFVKRWYRVMFSFKQLTWFLSLFTSRAALDVIRVKMEYDCEYRKHVVKDNALMMVLALGDPRVPVTEASAQYLMANIILMAEARGIGSCLMDSLRHTLNGDRSLRKILGIGKQMKVLAGLLLGYSDEKVLNIPQGYEIPIHRNQVGPLSPG